MNDRERYNAYMRTYLRKRRKRFREAGVCARCGRQRAAPWLLSCRKCLEETLARVKAFRKRKKEALR